MANEYLKASDFFKTIRPDERVYFLVRHGERGHILPDDPDHGAFVGLTERGREQALNLGRAMGAAIAKVPELRQGDTLASRSALIDLRHSEPAHFRHSEPRRDEESRAVATSTGSISFFSSPVGRCMETAQNIGRGFYEVLGSASPTESNNKKVLEPSRGAEQCSAFARPHQLYIPHVEPLQPLAEFFVEHYAAYMETHTTGFYQGICRWLDGTAANPDYIDPAYFPLASRSREMLDMMLEKGNARVNVFCSHDAWIVPCLAHFCGFKFTPQLWMNFLTGIAFVVRDGTAAKVDRIVAVTGLEDGNLFF